MQDMAWEEVGDVARMVVGTDDVVGGCRSYDVGADKISCGW